jgi:hypothetical protein
MGLKGDKVQKMEYAFNLKIVLSLFNTMKVCEETKSSEIKALNYNINYTTYCQ